MPMETFIPIIIALVIFAFQAYSNFQKEQEKAKKRDLGQQPPLQEDHAEWPPLPDNNPQRPVIADYWEEPVPAPAAPADPRKPYQAQRHPEPAVSAYEQYSGFVDAERIKRASKARQKQLTPKRVEVEERSDTGRGREATFDLRDAVIKSAILERPYQY